LITNFLCAIYYPVRSLKLFLNLVKLPNVKGEVRQASLWQTLQLATSKTANHLYDAGIRALKTTRRSTEGVTLYHKPGSLMTRSKKGRKRYSTRLPVMLSIALMLVFTAETAEITALVSKHSKPNSQKHRLISTRFDTDSYTISIDSHASACISHTKEHFKDLRHWSGSQLTGIGSTPIQGIGTLAWTICDDNGQPQEMLIANSLFVPTISNSFQFENS